ncbi:hypothetical protein LUZ62_069493 [Rhynchospora pubera]|uniref:Uncharacterized protein n=1 Tax=Rhynchospora pubera TaxID=906938 RepID=A0AAV8CT09_9POAL|nr:hypothetical protein LUZ62_069493 [Rhynchospora pubera]
MEHLSSRPIDHGTNRVGRPNHHTTRIDRREPPSLPYVRLSPHTARTKTLKSIPSFFFHLSNPILNQTSLPQWLRTAFVEQPCVFGCFLLQN